MSNLLIFPIVFKRYLTEDKDMLSLSDNVRVLFHFNNSLKVLGSNERSDLGSSLSDVRVLH